MTPPTPDQITALEQWARGILATHAPGDADKEQLESVLALCEMVRAQAHDIHAYRGALGYAVPGSHDGRLTDGTTTKCGLCDAAVARADQTNANYNILKDDYRDLLEDKRRAVARAEQAEQHIEAAWFAIEHGFDIEPREFFESDAPRNGFKWPLAQAVHHMWKRDPKVQAVADERDAARAEVAQARADRDDARQVSIEDTAAREEAEAEIATLRAELQAAQGILRKAANAFPPPEVMRELEPNNGDKTKRSYRGTLTQAIIERMYEQAHPTPAREGQS